MSAHAHADDNKFQLFVKLAMFLAIITGLEIITVYLPFVPWLLVTALITMSVVKFMYVIFVFMHLKWDKLFCTVLFFIGLILAGGTMWALLQLFASDASIPLSSL
jgi:cytochrome c oxidase subunit 4